MKLAGVLSEPPLDPASWSGTAVNFFGALDRAGILAGAIDARVSGLTDKLYRAANFSLPVARWRERYHLDPRRFRAQTRVAGRKLLDSRLHAEGVLQIGAWYCMPEVTTLPCYSYHDGNFALRLRSGRVALAAQHARVQAVLRWERETYAKLRGVFVMSSWLGDSFINDFGVPAGKVHVVGAGINFERLPAERHRTESAPRFLMVGKDFVRKGGEVLLKAFAIVRKAVPAAELVLIGPTMGSPPPGVRCLGFLSKKNPQDVQAIENAYLQAGIYVLPSLYEPFGISLLEAMSYSLPCVVANHCAMPEIVGHNESGLVVKPGDADALAAAMLELARDPARALSYGAAGRRRLLQRYTWDAVAAKIKSVVG